jgi:hypothetical protein
MRSNRFPKPEVRGSSPLRDAKNSADFANSYQTRMIGLLPKSTHGKHMGSRAADLAQKARRAPARFFCDRIRPMIRIAITPAAYAPIARRAGRLSGRPLFLPVSALSLSIVLLRDTRRRAETGVCPVVPTAARSV